MRDMDFKRAQRQARRQRWKQLSALPGRKAGLLLEEAASSFRDAVRLRVAIGKRGRTHRSSEGAVAPPRDDAQGAPMMEVLARLGHELRGPLGAINTAVELLGAQLPDDVELHEVKRLIERQVGYLVRLIDDHLDSFRVMAGNVTVQPVEVDLRLVLQDAIAACTPLIVERRHLVVTTQPEDAVVVEGDSLRLVQIVTNLLANAAKFTPSGGRIELQLQERGRQAVIVVSDDGVGIAADAIPRLFEPYVQLGTRPCNAGIGLGLSIVKRLVDLHGGTVTGRSPGLGFGSEFEVCLPLRAGRPAGTAKVRPDPQRDRTIARLGIREMGLRARPV